MHDTLPKEVQTQILKIKLLNIHNHIQAMILQLHVKMGKKVRKKYIHIDTNKGQ